MEKSTLRLPGPLKHTAEARSDADLVKEMRAYIAAQPAVRFLADVVTALHAAPHHMRGARVFLQALPPRQILPAFGERPDLRARLVKAITGSPTALLRRLPPLDLATQLELLVAEDLPVAERTVRAEEDRALPVVELYLKYLDAADLAVYVPAPLLWDYESQDGWWKRDTSSGAKALMAAELKSIRQHGILLDSEILDLVGDETMERDLPFEVRAKIRAAGRKAAREGRPFRDSDMFASLRSEDGKRDLTDELAENISLVALRKVVMRAAEILGLVRAEPEHEDRTDPGIKAAVEAAPTPPAAKAPAKQKHEPPAVTARPRTPAVPSPARRQTPVPPPREDAAVPGADELPQNFGEDVLDADTFVSLEDLTR
jgi:hypothetical protein